MSDHDRVRRHIYVDGRVQGVGFRYRTFYLAESLGLTGWVRNLDDGRVELELQGTEAEIRHLFDKLEENRFICITSRDTAELPVIEERGFRVRG